MATVLLIGTLDTKGPETAYLRDRVRRLGCDTLVLDSGILGEAVGIEADFDRRVVAHAAGSTLDALRSAGTRGKAVEEMLKGVRKLALQLFAEGRIHGVASLGGAEGAVLAAAAMKALPVGFPKLIVSPLASGHRKFAPFIGTKDILVMHSVVDILGINSVSRAVFDNAAAAIAGMANAYEAGRLQPARSDEHKAIAATMLGNTTRPLMRIKPGIEARGVDFVIFHANGVGGPAMEELIAQNYFAGILDYTLSEVAGYIAGGFHNGGPTRLDAAGEAGLPQVIVPGCLDFIVFGAKHEIPEQFKGRPTYYHNPEFTLVRLTEDEQLDATRFLVEKLNRAKGVVSVVVPLGGGSIMDIDGGAFWQPETNERCRQILREGLNPSIQYQEVSAHINDDAFADAVLDAALRVLV
ncbi:MAG: Tm-1-like ATP-binding domain-containing protein [Anaerolineae bacterium]|nr:Tm-1-like ATP-binding domain-containing protein [Anaerolineae bacterium]